MLAANALHFLYLKLEMVDVETDKSPTLNLHILEGTLKAYVGYLLASKSDT